jgi:hypothetical protein
VGLDHDCCSGVHNAICQIAIQYFGQPRFEH